MTEFETVDRRGKTVTVKPLGDGRLVLVSQNGWKEEREVIAAKEIQK